MLKPLALLAALAGSPKMVSEQMPRGRCLRRTCSVERVDCGQSISQSHVLGALAAGKRHEIRELVHSGSWVSYRPVAKVRRC
jgi:hypothetical protein